MKRDLIQLRRALAFSSSSSMRRQHDAVLNVAPLLSRLRSRAIIMSASYAHVAAAQAQAQARPPASRELAANPSRRPPDAKPRPPRDTNHAPSSHRWRRGAGAGTSSPSSYYRPATASAHGRDAPSSSCPVFVLTLHTGPPALEAGLSAQRRRWFPPARLRVPDAHVTVFHALPAGHGPDDGRPASAAAAVVLEALARAARTLPPRVPLRLGPAFRLGGGRGVGVGVMVDGNEGGVLGRTRRDLVRAWLGQGDVALSPQDRRTRWRPHYTVLNKEGDAARVAACLAAVTGEESAAAGAGEEGWADGFVLWRYERDGRWTRTCEFAFGEGEGGGADLGEEEENGEVR